MAPTPSQVALLRETYAAASQEHVFQFFDTLSPADQTSFFAQLSSISPSFINQIYTSAITAADLETSSSPTNLSAPPASRVGSVVAKPELAAEWNELGLKAIKEGKVAVLLMAGGQGTRLGSTDPKGCYDIGLPSGKSLFQLQAERIGRLAKVSGGAGIPWYIMTSGPTRRPTVEFFEKNAFFGLREEDVVFFEQGVLPCLSNVGKILLDTPSSVAVAPDGNGGIYAALRTPLSPSSSTSVLSDLTSRDISYLHAYCVDNCLVRVADPIFLGYCIGAGADCGAKVVKKTEPAEAVGVVALKSGKFGVVEYSEIPLELSEAREANGDLVFRAANIANHFYSLDFLTSVASFEPLMAHHIARKKIPFVDLTSGELVKPTKPNGMKLELFVFDVFPFTKTMAVLESARSTDFSPLKNAPGTGADDPETSRRDLLAEQKRWIEEAGATIAEGVEVEVSPAVSYAGEGLETIKGLAFTRSGVVESVEDFAKLA